MRATVRSAADGAEESLFGQRELVGEECPGDVQVGESGEVAHEIGSAHRALQGRAVRIG